MGPEVQRHTGRSGEVARGWWSRSYELAEVKPRQRKSIWLGVRNRSFSAEAETESTHGREWTKSCAMKQDNFIPGRHSGSFPLRYHTPVTVRRGCTAISATPENLLPASLPYWGTCLTMPHPSLLQGGGGCDTWSEALLRCTYLYLSSEHLNLSLCVYCAWQRQNKQTNMNITLADLPWVVESRLHQVPNMWLLASPLNTSSGKMVPCP